MENSYKIYASKQELELKVDKIEGKGLSTNDYTTEEKEKLADVESGANKTTIALKVWTTDDIA